MPDDPRPADALAVTDTAASNWTGTDPARPDGTLANGTLIGRYVVLEHLGAGGMGTVYRAYDPRLERNVAIKLLRPGRTTGPNATARMLREAQALAKLSHPNIVAVYDADTHDDQVFIAMELVDGITLRDWLRAAERSRTEIVGALVEAGRGLAAAHEAGLVHRDFKPANAMVGADGRVRVLDFGLASIGEHRGGDDEDKSGDLTCSGSIVGTPRYMAPEQHRGELASAAADQFALAVSLYEALYGEHPYGGDSAAELATRASAGQVRPAVPGRKVPEWLRAALVRGLAPDPARRFPSMAALLTELSRDRGGRRRLAITAIGTVALILAVVIALLASRRDSDARVAGVGPCSAVPSMLDGVWDDAARAEVSARAPSPEVGRALAARLDDYADEWLAQRGAVCAQRDEAYADRVQCLDSARVGLDTVRGLLATAEPHLFDDPEPLLATLPSLNACSQPAGELRWRTPPVDENAAAERQRVFEEQQRGFALRSAGKDDDARAVATSLASELDGLTDPVARANAARFAALYATDAEAVESLLQTSITAAIASRYEHGVVNAYADLIGHLTGQRRFDEAVRTVDLAHAHNQRLAQFVSAWPGMEQWSSLFGSRIANLRGLIERARGTHAAAIPHFRTAADLAEPFVAEHPDRLGIALTNLAEALRETGRYDEAITTYGRSLAVLERRRDTNHHNILSTLQNRAAANIAAGRAEAAVADTEAALALAAGKPAEADITYNLAAMRVAAGDLDGAERSLARAREIWTANLAAGHPLFAVGEVLECTLARERGELERSRTLGATASGALAAALGAKHPFVASARVELARTLIELGEARAAIEHLRAALAIYTATTGLDTADAAVAHAAAGRAHLALRRRADAIAALTAAIETYERMNLPNHPGLLTPLLDLAELHLAAGDRDQALAHIERALRIADIPGQTLAARDANRARALAAQLR